MKRIRSLLPALAVGWLLLGLGANDVLAQHFVRAGRMTGPGMVRLPYQQNDGAGNVWAVFDTGWLRQNAPQPIYGQAAMLTVDGAALQGNGNTGQVDAKTGELILDGMNVANVSVTRRILISKDEDYVRYVDIFKNTQNQEQSINVQWSTNVNFGVVNANLVADPKKHDNNIAWVGMTPVNRAAVEVFGGVGAKTMPVIGYQQGNNVVTATMQLTIPAGKQVAIMHLHATTTSIETGKQLVAGIKDTKLMQDMPADVRRMIVNFNTGAGFVGDFEILRGDAFDVVELHGGDQVKGTIRETSYKLAAFYGTIELPIEQVVGLINVGQFRPRQLLITADGQIFGGALQSPNISLELSSGQVTQIPLNQIARLGYRKRAGEPEEWTFDKPIILMRSGDRIAVQMPKDPVQVITRYGTLKLDPQAIASIAFQSEDTGVHEIYLTDGSKFAGLVAGDELEMKLSDPQIGQSVKFPIGTILRLQLTSKLQDTDDTTPSLALVNDDLMIGTLAGQIKLDTSFDTLTLNGPEIRRIIHGHDSNDVQVTLWDNTQVSGQLEEQEVLCQLSCGASIKVPVALLREYDQPMPQPSAGMTEKIKAAVADLNADDWKQRDQAESTLVTMGPSVASVLREVRAAQPPEAQQRIDHVLQLLEKQGVPMGHGPDAPPAGAVPQNGPDESQPDK